MELNGSIPGGASNVRSGTNPPFLVSDFLKIYPQFEADSEGNEILPTEIIQMYLDLAHASISEIRWRSSWKIAMGWFIAHFCSLHLQGMADPAGGAAGVIAAGEAKGLTTSKSVGPVSVSVDYSMAASDLDGWAAWKLTIYGQQLATLGRLVGKGGMFVY